MEYVCCPDTLDQTWATGSVQAECRPHPESVQFVVLTGVSHPSPNNPPLEPEVADLICQLLLST